VGRGFQGCACSAPTFRPEFWGNRFDAQARIFFRRGNRFQGRTGFHHGGKGPGGGGQRSLTKAKQVSFIHKACSGGARTAVGNGGRGGQPRWALGQSVVGQAVNNVGDWARLLTTATSGAAPIFHGATGGFFLGRKKKQESGKKTTPGTGHPGGHGGGFGGAQGPPGGTGPSPHHPWVTGSGMGGVRGQKKAQVPGRGEPPPPSDHRAGSKNPAFA